MTTDKIGRPSIFNKYPKMEEFLYEAHKNRPWPTANKIYEYFVEQFKKITDLPSEDAIIKRITRIRKELKNRPDSLLDTPWSIVACEQYGIPISEVPIILEYWRVMECISKKRNCDMSNRLSIRRARWIARLHPLVNDTLNTKFTDNRKLYIGHLSRLADIYARREELSEMTGKPLNTRDLDARFLRDQDISETAFMELAFKPLFEKECESK